MFKYVVGILGLVSLSTPVIAEVKPPVEISIAAVTAGNLLEQKNGVGSLVLTQGSSDIIATIAGCEAAWNSGDRFYLVSIPNAGMFLTKAKMFDSLYKTAKHDFMMVFSFLASKKQVCVVGSVKPLPKV